MTRHRYISVDLGAPPGFEVIREPTRRDLRGGVVALWSREPDALVERLGSLRDTVRGVLLCPGQPGHRSRVGSSLWRLEVSEEALPTLVELAEAFLDPYSELFDLRNKLGLRELELERERSDRMTLVDKLEAETKALRGLLVARTAWTAAAMTALVELNASELERVETTDLSAHIVGFLTGEPLSLTGAELWFADGGSWRLQARSGTLDEVPRPPPGALAGVSLQGDTTLLSSFAVAQVGGMTHEGLIVVQRPSGLDEVEASFLWLFSIQIASTYRARALHEALARASADKDDLIAELSTPIIQVWRHTVCVPVIGSIEAERAAQMTEALLDAVTGRGLRHVIVDFTGISTMDTQTVRHFTNLSRAIGLLGASCVFTGISPAVAQVLVRLGVDLPEIQAMPSVQAAIAALLGKPARQPAADESSRPCRRREER